MEIPYTVEIRRDTGLNNGKIAIWLFLASEVMLFGALFASYILIRTGSPSWPKGDTILNIPLATFNTVVLITSSITMVMAWASLMRRQFGKYRLYMGLTILLGFVFHSLAPGPQKYALTAMPPITCSMCSPVSVK